MEEGEAVLTRHGRRRSGARDGGAGAGADSLAVHVQVIPRVLADGRPWSGALVVGHDGMVRNGGEKTDGGCVGQKKMGLETLGRTGCLLVKRRVGGEGGWMKSSRAGWSPWLGDVGTRARLLRLGKLVCLVLREDC